jgi:Protein of unknown function (DUF4038)/Putative collagen-binding domain of a collagenase
MKALLLLITLLCTLPCFPQLKVSENKRFIVKADGSPFFWLGDTAWELFHRLNREEAVLYLKNRRDKKFTVIQAVVLAEMDGVRVPNAYGDLPLIDEDPNKPNEAYFQHVDYIIKQAEELGLHIALLPTWGDKVFKDRWGMGPEIFNPANASIYGKWLGNRYKESKNIIWVIGGDRNPRNESEINIWRSMAKGIESGVGGSDKALMTFHPQPNSLEDAGSSKWFHNDDWLDFNMFQTGHCRENNIWDRIQIAYNKPNTKPVLDGETLYEDHPVCFNAKDLGYSSAYDIRKHAYIDVFAGAFGHTYGCHDIWQMYAPNRTPVNGPLNFWYVAMNLPGADQMQHLRNLIESRPMLDRVPDQSIITDALGANNRIQATRGKNYLFVYSSQGASFKVRMGKIEGKKLKGYWYEPKNGNKTLIGEFENKGEQLFTPPSSGYGVDWVLVLE